MTMTSETWTPPSEFAAQCRELWELSCPPRWGTPRRPERKTLGPRVAKVMTKLGYPPMPWQQYVLDVALEIDPETGRFAYREVGLSVPRQQGKTQQILGVMTHRIAAWTRQNVVYAAQTRGMARTRWEDEFIETLDASSLAGKYRTRKNNGNEAIIWTSTRSKLGITSNTEKAGHGPPLDLGVIDEAFAHEDDRLEQAMSPAMLTRPKAQLWWASAGGTEKSAYLNRKRQRGRELIEELWKSGEFPAVAYFEWFAPDDMDRTSPATWRACMPALGHTVDEATVRAELDKLEAPEFDRAYLNRTRKATPPQDPNIPVKLWPQRAEPTSKASTDVALALDVSADRTHSSIGLASVRADGREHWELVDRRAGTDWVVPALVKLKRLHHPVAIAVAATGSPAASLIDDLVAAGIDAPEDPEHPQRGDLAVLRSGDQVEACGQWADAVAQGTAVHIEQAPLTAAVTGARTRSVGDAWVLHRKSSLTDVSPLCAVVWARWALLTRLPAVSEDYDVLESVY
ncbi:terminase large subunit domain-containing protein [Streptomyces sp. NBC_01803]|uniref:terminase large subunit domain-containing protein n=1 Tax=Streptomyces sp. NBC_01803 TaxID=2975946 RepID=UPI002DDC70DC|nr:terminase family protein [Streptomyces sp. NBC_01803]WSA44996.1 terminase [Streptomyces sp. NBC_01803]